MKEKSKSQIIIIITLGLFFILLNTIMYNYIVSEELNQSSRAIKLSPTIQKFILMAIVNSLLEMV